MQIKFPGCIIFSPVRQLEKKRTAKALVTKSQNFIVLATIVQIECSTLENIKHYSIHYSKLQSIL